MLVQFVRKALLAEALAVILLAAWLHSRGWGLALAVSAPVALSLAVRLGIVSFSMTLSHFARSPREPAHQLGPVAALRLLLGEWRAMLANNFCYLPFENVALPPEPPRDVPAGVAVLVIHGYFSNRGILSGVVRDLASRGASPVFTFNFRGTFLPIDELAGQLASQVDSIVRAGGAQAVVLVAHSMGGLVARAFLARHGASRVVRLVTLASPHNGTRLAKLGLGANARQMRPDSEFLEGLRRREGASGPGVPVTSIYSVHDNLVSPQDTSRLPYAKNIALHGVGHIDILLDARVHELVARELEAAGVEMKPGGTGR
jgi:triacylglycerol esterase/lipase EstA (alpha/beta hydrolase family)